MLPSTTEVIAYLNKDIMLMSLHLNAICRDCEKNRLTCGGCKEAQNLSEAIILYKKMVQELIFKRETAESEMRV